ncbi:IclR family transcriptional regulator, partial [Streptomyces milbemycinicus]
VRLGVPLEGKVLIVHHVFRPDDTFQTLDVGSLLPLHASALGKILLAFGATPLEPLMDPEPESYTRHTLVSRQQLNRALSEIREAGWAAAVQEMMIGEADIAAPVRGQGGLVVGAVGISGAVDRLCDSRGRPQAPLVGLTRDAARAISRDLGAARW